MNMTRTLTSEPPRARSAGTGAPPVAEGRPAPLGATVTPAA